MKRLALLVVVVWVGAGCRVTNPSTGTVPFDRLTPPGREGHAGLTTAQRVIVTDAEAFATIWTGAYGAETPVPNIDFSRDVVVVAALGERFTGGYTIQVSEIREQGHQLIVTSVVHMPGCAAPTVLTQPNDMVKVARRVASATFRDVEVARHCN